MLFRSSSIVGNSAANAFCSRPGLRIPSDGAYELGREDAELWLTWDQRASLGRFGEWLGVESEAVDMRWSLGWRRPGECWGW